jgi:hypothetical protein
MTQYEAILRMVNEQLSYSPETGEFRWMVAKRGGNCIVGGLAGSFKSKRNAVYVMVNKRMFLAHRLAWLVTYGVWPEKTIDHINGDGRDNRIANLRLADSSEQKMNGGWRTDNTSGYRGVTFDKRRMKWKAQIKMRGKHHNIGHYDSPLEAHAAYAAAKSRLHIFQPTCRIPSNPEFCRG